MSLNPHPTLLDQNQILQRSFDETADRLRVDAEVTANISGAQEVIITDIDDSIKIGNGNNGPYLKVNSDGSINVNSGSSGSNASVGLDGSPAPTSSTQIGGQDPSGNLAPTLIDDNGRLLVNSSEIFGIQNLNILYNEVSTIAVGIETIINTYTAPIGKISYLLTILNSGENRGQFNIYNNSVLFDKQYTNVTQLTVSFDYKTGSGTVPGFVIPVGNVIQVKTINSGTSTANYSSRFMILEVT